MFLWKILRKSSRNCNEIESLLVACRLQKKDVAEFPTYSKLSKAVSSEADTHKRPQKQRLFLPAQKAVGQEPAHRFVVQFQTEIKPVVAETELRPGRNITS